MKDKLRKNTSELGFFLKHSTKYIQQNIISAADRVGSNTGDPRNKAIHWRKKFMQQMYV